LENDFVANNKKKSKLEENLEFLKTGSAFIEMEKQKKEKNIN
jgi:hypothetical protein